MTALSILRTLIAAAPVILAMLAYYEGLPVIRDAPFLDRVPVLRELTVGRVASYAADAVAAANRQCEADKSSMVDRAIADALAATLAQERRYRNAADIAAADAQKRAGEALLAKEEADERVRALQAEAERDNLPTWTPEELEWYGAR